MITQEIEQQICRDHLNGILVPQLRESYSISRYKLNNILQSNNIKLKKASGLNRRKYTHNSNFFSVPNEINSYWAGFIAADGNICISKERVNILLHEKDFKHLYKFKKAIQGTEPIYQRNFIVDINVYDTKFKQDLSTNFNIVPKKSLILVPPNIKNKNLVRAYIRGYFDGDGSIFKSGGYSHISLVGTYEMLNWIKINLRKYLDFVGSSVSKSRNIFQVSIGGEFQVKKIMDYLYKDTTSDVRLDRKYARYIEYFYNE